MPDDPLAALEAMSAVETHGIRPIPGAASADTLARADFHVGHVGRLEVEVASGALRLSFAGG